MKSLVLAMSDRPLFDRQYLSPLENKLGHVFKNPMLLFFALTHSSFSNEMKTKGTTLECNERLEFLGDSVLSLITSEFIFSRYPDMPEGDMSRLRACAVESSALVEYSKRIGLGDYLFLGHGEDNESGRNRISTLENAFESVTAAIYLDAGIEEAKKFVLPFVTEKIKISAAAGDTRDYKTQLQQIVQQERGERLEYILVAESGPDHKKCFEVEAHINSNVIGRGVGSSKRAAEQMAASDALNNYFGGQ